MPFQGIGTRGGLDGSQFFLSIEEARRMTVGHPAESEICAEAIRSLAR